MKHALFLVILTIAFLNLSAQNEQPFAWDLSYEHRLAPIYFQRANITSVSPIIYNQDQQLSGSGFSGTITKRIYKGLGIFYRMHVRYDHLYFRLDTNLVLLENEQTWFIDHILGISHLFGPNQQGKGFLLRLGFGFMNRGSNYALVERLSLPNFPGIHEITEHHFHYAANILEAKWIWQKFGFGCIIYHATNSRFNISSPFIHLGISLSYGVY